MKSATPTGEATSPTIKAPPARRRSQDAAVHPPNIHASALGASTARSGRTA